MFPPIIRKLMIMVALAAAIFKYSQGDSSGFVYLAAAGLLAYYHFRTGSMLLAYSAFRRQDFKLLRKLIDGTSKPEWLRPSSRACYYFLKGILATVDENYAEAKTHYLQAANRHLKPKHLQCLAYCALADMSLHLDQQEEAREFLATAKTFPDEPGVNEMIEQLEQKLTAGGDQPRADDDQTAPELPARDAE